MKYQYALLVILAVLSFTAKSQNSYFGIKGGFNWSSLKSEETAASIDLSIRRAYAVGIVLSQKFHKLPLGVSIEPGYTLKGTKVDVDTLDYKFHYLSLPVLIDIYPIEKLKISFGPEISYLANAKNRVNDSTKVSLLGTYDNRWELSGTVGISYSIAFFADLGLRYNTSFTKISAYDPTLEHRNLFNQYFQVFMVFKVAN